MRKAWFSWLFLTMVAIVFLVMECIFSIMGSYENLVPVIFTTGCVFFVVSMLVLTVKYKDILT